MERNRTAPDWKEGEPFIEWCRRVTLQAFKTSEMHGQMNALEFLNVNSSRWEIMK